MSNIFTLIIPYVVLAAYATFSAPSCFNSFRVTAMRSANVGQGRTSESLSCPASL